MTSDSDEVDSEKSIALETKGDACDFVPFICWDGLHHIFYKDHEICPVAQVDGSQLLVVKVATSARLGGEFAAIQWHESWDFEDMQIDLQTDTPFRRHLFRNIYCAAPKAKILFHWPFDEVADWYKLKGHNSGPTAYESFRLEAGPASKDYDIDSFVDSFDRWTDIDMLA